MNKTTSTAGIALIKRFEGCRLEAYKCPADVWTIGYGHTGSVDGKAIGAGMKITLQKADELLKADLAKFEAKVNKYDKYKWTQNEFDAMVSFAYNIGNIDQLTAKGTRTKDMIAAKLPAYNKAAGKVLAGLTKRRKAEQELFLRK
ncbi:lysozyme [Anaerocolumna chitinilytica]|uniref:Lysozyme n=1 Tax=Anaerocolumna chitinilytica TaxID=1727145 RepID=A0A7M3SAH2_9FIRM|nr:lysozyme [Anaerocolumna chitinilytica]BCK01590.1 lysozyme [Anaerocolumna chitinilytica]